MNSTFIRVQAKKTSLKQFGQINFASCHFNFNLQSLISTSLKKSILLNKSITFKAEDQKIDPLSKEAKCS
jgi:pullulanase/glycogen debranching enzyme